MDKILFDLTSARRLIATPSAATWRVLSTAIKEISATSAASGRSVPANQ